MISGERSVELNAPAEQVWQVVSNVEAGAEWQASLKSVTVLERDAQGRASLVEELADAKIKTIRAVLRYTYGPGVVSWVQEKGDAKSVVGSWKLDDLGAGRTRATFAIETDLGRVLGMVLRPVEDKVVDVLAGGAVNDLKAHVER